MHKITAVATDPVSSPKGDSQLRDGVTACSPAVPLYTLTRAITLSRIRTRNWKLDQDDLDPLAEDDAAVGNVGHHHDEEASRAPTWTNVFSASSSAPRNSSR